MDNSVVFLGNKGKLRLGVLDYENKRPQNVDDVNWLRAELDVDVGAFSGKICFGLTAVELERLHQ